MFIGNKQQARIIIAGKTHFLSFARKLLLYCGLVYLVSPLCLPLSAAADEVATPDDLPTQTVNHGPGALLPASRIIAYYGNFYSPNMGVLGRFPEEKMLAMLQQEVEKWKIADPNTQPIPAIDYIAVVAQKNPGKDGKYRARMPADEIEYALQLAQQINGVAFLDVQVGQSNLQTELPLLEEYLKRPDVHLSIDPEFSMKQNRAPGTHIGTFDAADINYAIKYLDDIVTANNLPPKILVIHRFTQHMITNASAITPTKNVEVVVNMDGWGTPQLKKSVYNNVVAAEPVEFTGFKLFYKNDRLPPSSGMLPPEQILQLDPVPHYIQYQ